MSRRGNETAIESDTQSGSDASRKLKKAGDMGQGSREEAIEESKGPSESKQGPKKVRVKNAPVAT